MRRFLSALAISMLCGLLPESRATAQATSDVFEAGRAAFTSGNYEQALIDFEAARDGGAQGPAVYYNIGVCQYRLQHYEEAANAFGTLIEDYPAMRNLAEYNLGLVRMKQGRESEARQYFEQVSYEGHDEKLNSLAEAMLRRIDAADRSVDHDNEWINFIDVSIGHDDNVALIDEANLAAGQSVDSPFTELLVVVSGPISSASGLRFDGSVYDVRYSDAGEYDQTAVRLGGVYAWNSGQWHLEAGPGFGYSTLNGDGFERRLGVGMSVRRDLGSSLKLGLSFGHDEVDDINAEFAYVNGSRDRVGVTLDRFGDSGRLTLGYRWELNDRADASVSPVRNRASLRYRYAMSPSWSVDGQLAYRRSVYGDLPVARDENRLELSLGLVRHLAGWEVNGNYSWYDNESNVDIYSYERSRLMLGLTKSF